MNKITFLIPVSALRKPIMAMAAAVCLTMGSTGFLFTHSTHAKPPPNSTASALTVTLASAEQAQWPNVLESNGAILPWQEAVIGAQVSGLRLTDIRVNVGDLVRQGQVLAVFDADMLRADEARLQALWQQAEANRQRAMQLKGSGGISEQEVLQYVTQASVAKAQLDSTRLQVRYGTVISPDDGVISARSAALGAVSSSGQELFRMIRKNRLEWRGELTATQMAHVKTGQRVALALPNGATANARVRQTAPGFDTQTRLGIVYADIESGSTARAGMYAKGRVALTESVAIFVPAASVIVRDGRSYVPKVAPDRRVTLQVVDVGRRQAGAVEILSGIQPGDQVPVQGAGFLNEGDLVRIASETPSATKGQ